MTPALRPVECREAKVILQTYIRAGINQETHNIHIATDDGADKWCLTTLNYSVRVCAFGEQIPDGVNIACVGGTD